MKPYIVFINAIAFTALFVVYEGVGSSERPDGVRRALQTYAKILPTGNSALPMPRWQDGIEMGDLV
ncbi:hypothetical protein [Ensifer adhaerens]|uniref:Uncharacterized protein n=1 Tax=Ensifer adhaerens TaxID=106592 RepID=A0A9Q8YGF4_ENSAD|nr:hypothetical protein [Ensifer adhaerens]USJ27680.1 hypothetical protein NE863_27595 [Ensifer adhaerens]